MSQYHFEFRGQWTWQQAVPRVRKNLSQAKLDSYNQSAFCAVWGREILRSGRCKALPDSEEVRKMRRSGKSASTETVRAACKKTRKLSKSKARQEPKTKAQSIFQGQNHQKKQRKLTILNQWIEVEVVEGRTVTKLYPSNEKLIEEGKAMLPAPDLVYRRFHFPSGVPTEYHWATKNPQARERGGMGIQRMTVDHWLHLIEREKREGTGHLGPTGVPNLPRPAEHGVCECEVCTRLAELSEANSQAESE